MTTFGTPFLSKKYPSLSIWWRGHLICMIWPLHLLPLCPWFTLLRPHCPSRVWFHRSSRCFSWWPFHLDHVTPDICFLSSPPIYKSLLKRPLLSESFPGQYIYNCCLPPTSHLLSKRLILHINFFIICFAPPECKLQGLQFWFDCFAFWLLHPQSWHMTGPQYIFVQ